MLHLQCVHPFGDYVKGQIVKDATEIAMLTRDRDHHFVRIAAPPEAAQVDEAPSLDQRRVTR